MCLDNCLRNMDDLEDETLACNVCSVFNSMIKHFANCSKSQKECSICIQIFTLICSHINNCTNNNNMEQTLSGNYLPCKIQLCQRVRLILDGASISAQLGLMWFKIRKMLARFIDGIPEELEDEVEVKPPPNSNSHVDSSLPSMRRPSLIKPMTLPSIPEGGQLPSQAPAHNSSRVLVRKPSSLATVAERQNGSQTGDGLQICYKSIVHNVMVPAEMQQVGESEAGFEQASSLADSHSVTSDEDSFKNDRGITSLPTDPPGKGKKNPYYPSMKEKPTGIRGIGQLFILYQRTSL